MFMMETSKNAIHKISALFRLFNSILTAGDAIGVVPVDLGLSTPLHAIKLSGSLLKLGNNSSALSNSSFCGAVTQKCL